MMIYNFLFRGQICWFKYLTAIVPIFIGHGTNITLVFLACKPDSKGMKNERIGPFLTPFQCNAWQEIPHQTLHLFYRI